MGPSMAKAEKEFSEKETKKRFDAALRGGLNTPPLRVGKKKRKKKTPPKQG
jgi:hypothetical protein